MFEHLTHEFAIHLSFVFHSTNLLHFDILDFPIET